MATAALNLDPRIGVLNGGKFYCFPNGYGKPELIGTLEEVENALGIRSAATAPVSTSNARAVKKLWTVRLTFQYPAWDEVEGIEFADISANSKSEANAIARRRAERDGHLGGGKGRVVFTATEQ